MCLHDVILFSYLCLHDFFKYKFCFKLFLLQDPVYQASNIEVQNNDESQCERVGIPSDPQGSTALSYSFGPVLEGSSPIENFDATCVSGGDVTEVHGSTSLSTLYAAQNDVNTAAASSDSPFYQLRKYATAFVSQTLERGRRNLWQLTTSRVSVLLSCSAICSTSTIQFLKNYEDLNVFILAGEAFCGVEATEFRQRLRSVSENYVAAFHRQNVYVCLSMTHPCDYILAIPITIYKFVDSMNIKSLFFQLFSENSSVIFCEML